MSHQLSREDLALDSLATEAINADMADIDALDVESRLRLMNAQDALVAAARLPTPAAR